jgi:hypothetical protein
MNEIKNHIDAINKKYNKHTVKNPNFKQNEMFLPSRCIFVGPSGSGKTNGLYEFLIRTNGAFNELHICAKNPDQAIYDYLQRKLKDRCIMYEVGVIPSIEDFDDTESKLIIFDDYVNDLNAQKKITDFYIRGRHKKFSVAMATQSFFKVLKNIRMNSDYVMIFKVNSQKDLKLILSEFPLDITFDELLKMYKDSTQKKGDFMMVDIPNEKIRHNFLKYLC